jgi:microcystin-dependent protein
MGGKESVTMTALQMPAHNHSATATIRFPASVAGGGEAFTSRSILGGMQGAYSSQAADTYLAPESATSVLSTVGSNIPFDIIQPVMAANYIICLEGIYPSRN